MIALHRLLVLGLGLSVVGEVGPRAATDPTGPASLAGGSAADSGTTTATPTHKTHHRKRKSVAESAATTQTATGATASTSAGKKKTHRTSHVAAHSTTPAATPAAEVSTYSSALPPALGPAPAPVETLGKTPQPDPSVDMTLPPLTATPATVHIEGVPEVNTGLPVAKDGKTYQIASTFPVPSVGSTLGSFSSHGHSSSVLDNFSFTNFTTRHARNFYPWKIDIFTTKFWIGEGSTPISSMDNMKSAWDEDWRSNNGGSDLPGNDREGYMPAHHAARINPFYVALPFNDLAFPEKARRWLPAGWYRPPRDNKPVSACLNRWVEIKNAQGDTCYAQWKDVGPLRYDDAEYVFGDERPGIPTSGGFDHAGLDVSPAVADYLDIDGKNCTTRWRFVDDADVQPGVWLKYDEEALIFKAMHELKQDPAHILPIQKAAAPIEDDSDLDSAKKRIGSAKG